MLNAGPYAALSYAWADSCIFAKLTAAKLCRTQRSTRQTQPFSAT